MTATQKRRLAALLPAGVPHYVRCYDAGPNDTLDRYTVCFTGRAATIRSGYARSYPYLAMSTTPTHPQGFGQHGESPDWPCDTMRAGTPAKPGHTGWNRPPAIGRKCHLGKRIAFAALPADCRRLVLSDYRAIWRLDTP